jgi:transportin-3
VKAILSIPSTAHTAVRYTSIQLFGELCEWIEKHEDYLGKSKQLVMKQ